MNNSYWEKRRARELYEQFEKVEAQSARMTRVYTQASMQVEEDARRILRRFALRHSLSEAEAKRVLAKMKSAEDIRALKFALAINPDNAEIARELEAPAYAARLARLVEVQKNVDYVTERLRRVQEEMTRETLAEMAEDSYYHSIYDMQLQANAAFPFEALDKSFVKELLQTRWSGENFSARIWQNNEALAERVKDELLISMLTGRSATKASQKIADAFDVEAWKARRLLRTESAYVDGQVRLAQYKKFGVEVYIYTAILDLRTSQICREHDKKRYLVKNAEVGVNYPPLHPWCRSSTIEDMPDELLKRLKQSAINPETGEQITVPLSMTYDEWYKQYVKPKEEAPAEAPKAEAQTQQTTAQSFAVDALHPETVGGAHRTAEFMTYDDADNGEVNPNIYKGGAYTINCQSCVVAFEARQRGYDVEALPKTSAEASLLSLDTRRAWLDADTGALPKFIDAHKATTPKSCLQFLHDSVEQGARYTLGFSWKGRRNSGHIVNLDRTEDGLLRITDNQRATDEIMRYTGDEEVLQYLSRIKYFVTSYGVKYPNPPQLMRVDDKLFNEEICNGIMKAKD